MMPPHWFGTPLPPHVWGAAHGPQFTVPPQPSAMTPHWALACWQVRGWQLVRPQTPGVPPPPHVSGATQVPH